MAERREAVEGEAEHLAQRELRLAARPGRAHVGHADLPEPDPRRHPADEAVPLAQPAERGDGLRAHEPEVADVDRDVDVRPALQEPVEDVRRPELERALALALRALRVDDLVALVDPLQHLAEELGRILQVGVHDGDDAPARGVDARGERHLVAEVAREAQGADAAVARARTRPSSRTTRRGCRRRRRRSPSVRPVASSAFTRRSRSSSRFSASLKTGSATERSGALARAVTRSPRVGGRRLRRRSGGRRGGGDPAGYCRRKTVTHTAPIGLLPSARSHASRVKTYRRSWPGLGRSGFQDVSGIHHARNGTRSRV